ncbi:hypothetical protein HpBTM60_03040 [Helicobacter pylori]
MNDWKSYQIILFIGSVVFFLGFLLDFINVFSFGETFRLVLLFLFTLSTSIYLFEREKIASLLFIISSILILVSLIF